MNIYDEYFDDLMTLFPSMNDYLQVPKYKKNRVRFENSIAPEYNEKIKNIALKYKEKLKKIKKKNIYDKILQYEIDSTLDGLEYPLELLPLDQFNNQISGYFQEANGEGMFEFKTVKDYKDFMEKNKEFALWCCQAIINMNIGIEKNFTLPKKITEILIEDIENILHEKLYYNENVPKSLRKEWDTNMETYVLKPTRRILEFLQNVYVKNCRKSLAFSKLPNGKKMYKYIVETQTTNSKLSVEQIHKLGWKEVKRLSKELQKISVEMGYKNITLRQFLEKIKNRKDNHYKNKKELMDHYKKLRTDLWNNLLPKYFDIKIKDNFQLKEVPEAIAESMAGAYYEGGDVEGKRVGTFYLNTRDVKNMLKSGAMALSKHEGIPGHHYQITINNTTKKSPMFMKASSYVGFEEGWGLYAENLGEYDTLGYVGKLNSEMFRALRLIIDTGIHHYGWSYEKCVKLFQKYSLLAKSEIDAEFYRYVAMPGQALAYKIGELTILQLREKFKGDIKKFHRIVLEDGSLPLDILISKFKK